MRPIIRLLHLLLPTLLAIWSLSLPGEEPPAVTWMISDAPPSYILDGPLAGQGIADQELSYLTRRLTGYRHRTIMANSARVWEEIAHHDGQCLVGAVMTEERKALALFSRRPRLKANYRTLFKDGKKTLLTPFIDADGAFNPMLLQEGKGLQAATALRPMPPELTAMLAKTNFLNRLEKRPLEQQVVNLLIHDRVDFAFVNGTEARYFSEIYPEYHLVSLPIRGLPPLSETYVACSNGPIGRHVIEQIDLLLQDDQSWAEFLASIKRWSTPEEFAQALAAQPRR